MRYRLARKFSHPRALTAPAAVLGFAATTLLAACGSTPETSAPEPKPEAEQEVQVEETEKDQPTPTSSEQASAEETEPPSSAASKGAEESETASASESSSARSSSGMPEDVAEAYNAFKTLAPKSLFEDFDSCESGGMQGTYNCAGSKAGQWQLFDSASKASQSTQVLTELRSSTVVEDSGDKVVGWSTLGSTAIITLVDNDEGLVMQQMTSLDQDDPEKRLEELGLVEKKK